MITKRGSGGGGRPIFYKIKREWRGGKRGFLTMEKFAVDLDAVLDEFEYHEGQVRKATK